MEKRFERIFLSTRKMMRDPAVRRILFSATCLALFSAFGIFFFADGIIKELVRHSAAPIPIWILAVLGCVLLLSPLCEGIQLCAFLCFDGESSGWPSVFYFYTERGAYLFALRRGLSRALRFAGLIGGTLLASRLGVVLSRMLYRHGDVMRGTLIAVLTVLFLVLYACFFWHLGREDGLITPLYYQTRLVGRRLYCAATEAIRPYRGYWARMRLVTVLLALLCVLSLGLFACFAVPCAWLLRANYARRILD